MTVRTLSLLLVGLTVAAQSCAPLPPHPSPDGLCQAPPPDMASWQQLTVGWGFAISAPPGLRPDTSAQVALAFYHGGQQWVEPQLTVYWDVSSAAYGGLMHDSLRARLARPALWPTPAGCESPTVPGWVIRSSVAQQKAKYSADVWMMERAGPQDQIYHLQLEAGTDSAFVKAAAIVRSLRFLPPSGG